MNPILQQTPFRNPQTGAFDKDMLKKFLVDYAKMDKKQMTPQYLEYYESLHKFWSFIEKSLTQSRLAEKYQALVTKALFSNSVEAQAAFDARVNQMDLLLAAVPYSSIVDSTVVVKDSEIKDLYNKKKEQFKQYVETRDVKYIDVQVTASAEDKAAIQKEVAEYTNQLAAADVDYTSFIRTTGSTYPYVDIPYTKKALPTDIAARLDSVSMGQVYGPYYNAGDNTINSFKVLAKEAAADSVEFRQIQVLAADAAKTKVLADSIMGALKAGGDFAAIAKKYGQTGDANWMSSANYENAQVDGDNLKFLKAVTSLGVNELANLSLGQANVILQVTNKKGVQDKYKVAVIKRTVEFSKDTYNKAYNDFSQFVAANPTLDKLTVNAEEAGYKLLERKDLYSSEHGIGGVRGTKEALKWIFAAKQGEVSGLYECGESDHMMVVALAGVTEEGYRSVDQVKDQLRAELIRDKKAEKLIAQLGGVKASSIEQFKSVANVVTDSVKHVTFAAPAYVAALRSSEPLVGAYASVAQLNQVSAPIKGKAEENTIESMHQRMASRFVNDLYLKANVKDKRYLFF